MGGLGGGKEKMGGKWVKKGFGERREKIGKNLGFWGEKMVFRGVWGGGREEEMGGKFGVSVSPYWLPLTPNS